MKSDRIQSAIGEIDADLIEAAEQEGTSMKHKTSFARVGLLAACLALIVTAAIVVPRLTRPEEEANAGGTDGRINIHAEIKPSDADRVLTDGEAAAFLAERLPAIREELRANGVAAEALRIPEKGYSHVRTGDNGNELILYAKDYLIYDGETLVGIYELIKDADGSLGGGLSWGGPWFPEYQAFLEAHRGEALVYLYVGDVEAILTPDGRIVTPLSVTEGVNALRSVIVPEEQAQYYEFFRREENTYTP